MKARSRCWAGKGSKVQISITGTVTDVHHNDGSKPRTKVAMVADFTPMFCRRCGKNRKFLHFFKLWVNVFEHGFTFGRQMDFDNRRFERIWRGGGRGAFGAEGAKLYGG